MSDKDKIHRINVRPYNQNLDKKKAEEKSKQTNVFLDKSTQKEIKPSPEFADYIKYLEDEGKLNKRSEIEGIVHIFIKKDIKPVETCESTTCGSDNFEIPNIDINNNDTSIGKMAKNLLKAKPMHDAFCNCEEMIYNEYYNTNNVPYPLNWKHYLPHRLERGRLLAVILDYVADISKDKPNYFQFAQQAFELWKQFNGITPIV